MKRAIGVLVLATALVGALVTGAFASIPDSSGVIHACLQPKTGAITKVIDTNAGQTCARSEQALNWNQAGPRGPAGPAAQVTIQTRVQRFFEPPPEQGQIGGGIVTTASCPSGKHAVNGGVLQSRPLSADENTNSEPTSDPQQFVHVPRPVNNDTAWRISVVVGWPTPNGPPVDVTIFTMCV